MRPRSLLSTGHTLWHTRSACAQRQWSAQAATSLASVRARSLEQQQQRRHLQLASAFTQATLSRQRTTLFRIDSSSLASRNRAAAFHAGQTRSARSQQHTAQEARDTGARAGTQGSAAWRAPQVIEERDPGWGGPAPPSHESEPVRPRIVRPVLFAVLVGGLAIIYTAEMTNEDIRYHAARAADARGMLSAFGGSATSLAATGGTGVSVREMHMSRAQEHAQRTLSLAKTFGNTGIPMIDSAVLALANKWYRTDEATRTSAGIIVACSVVWAAWHVKRWQPHMWKWWAHQPLSGRSTTLLTSVFSHVTLPHLALNSIALLSFGSAVHSWMMVPPSNAPSDVPPALTTRYQFIGFFIAAGLASSLVSHAYRTLFVLPRMARTIARNPAAQIDPILPSVGMSGAVYAALVVTALAFPTSKVSLIFLPFTAVPISAGLTGLVCIDILGLIRGWRSFDHAAHLGGALFGWLYMLVGKDWWADFRAESWRMDVEAEGDEHS